MVLSYRYRSSRSPKCATPVVAHISPSPVDGADIVRHLFPCSGTFLIFLYVLVAVVGSDLPTLAAPSFAFRPKEDASSFSSNALSCLKAARRIAMQRSATQRSATKRKTQGARRKAQASSATSMWNRVTLESSSVFTWLAVGSWWLVVSWEMVELQPESCVCSAGFSYTVLYAPMQRGRGSTFEGNIFCRAGLLSW